MSTPSGQNGKLYSGNQISGGERVHLGDNYTFRLSGQESVMPDGAFHFIKEALRSAIHHMNPDQFLEMLSVLNQDKYISTIPPLDRHHPTFSWIFGNVDFTQWSSSKCSRVLWLSGPARCDIHQVSSYIVGQKKTDHVVLYFFCSGETMEASTVVHTLLSQVVSYSPVNKHVIIQKFLHSLREQAFDKEGALSWKQRHFEEEDSSHMMIKKVLDAPIAELWAAFGVVLCYWGQRELSIVIDGLEHVQIRGVRAFVERLEQRTSTVKVLLTSRPLDDIKTVFYGLPCIEYDAERRECLASLRFENTRYDKISSEHAGSFWWIWQHDEYRNWSTPDASRLLYIQGKPGSGKSTLTKYVNRNLLEREPAASSAIVARFFYSFRDGELQRSHYNMLQSILYDILEQDEAFFYHRFQTEYRHQQRREPHVAWDYESLKTVLNSLQDYPLARRLYLIIDAIDESEENDRRDVLKLLLDLCSETNDCTMKVFVASRPVGEELELRRNDFHGFIRLQDETKPDITSFAHSSLRLNLTRVLTQATDYIVENAQGVFLWVKLVVGELLTCAQNGDSEEEIFGFLKELPTELEDFYKLMFKRMNKDKRNLPYAVKMFQFVLFARRPLAVDELLHALGIPDNPNTEFTLSDQSFQKRIPNEQRIISCGGNFLETKQHHGNRTVQVIHQTVREFFLRPDGHVAKSDFKMCERDAHICISLACIRYLMLCASNPTLAGKPRRIKTSTYIRYLVLRAANITLVGRLPGVNSWTSGHFEEYAKNLDKWPLANFALGHLKHHIDGSQRDATIRGAATRLIVELTRNPAVYLLLESWIGSNLNTALLSNKRGAAARDFRNKMLHGAAQNGFSTAAAVLLAAGADVDAKDGDGWTALHWAANRRDKEMTRLLVLEGKADVNVKDGDGWTALHRAAERGHEEMARLLVVELKADANAQDKNGWTALYRAAERGHEAVVRLLVVEGKADVNAKNNGWTALHRAAERGHEAVVRLLVVEGKADVNAKNNGWKADVNATNNGWTALHRAAERGHEAVVRLLVVEGKADVNAKTEGGWTALHRAAGRGHEAVVRLLVVEGEASIDADR